MTRYSSFKNFKYSSQISENEFQSWEIFQYVNLRPIRIGVIDRYHNQLFPHVSLDKFMRLWSMREICLTIPSTLKSYTPCAKKGLLKSAKILLLPPKYEIIMVLSNHAFFQYCDSNIGLSSITPCKVINLNPFCILFGICSLLLFLKLSLFLAFKDDSEKITVIFRLRL